MSAERRAFSREMNAPKDFARSPQDRTYSSAMRRTVSGTSVAGTQGCSSFDRFGTLSGAAAGEQTITLLPHAVHGPNPAYQADVGHTRV